MKLIDELVAQAATADGLMGDLAAEGTKNHQRQQAYGKLENTLERMSADGYLDAGELKELLKEFRAQGLSTRTIEDMITQLNSQDGSSRTQATSEKVTQLRAELFDAKAAAGNDPLFHLKAQELVGTYNKAFDLAARVSKSEHDIYMTAIRHLAG